MVSGYLGQTSLDVLFCHFFPGDVLVVSYTTCWKLVQQGVLLSSNCWASALSIYCTRLSAWLVFLSLLVFSFTGFIAPCLIVFSPYTEDYRRYQHLVVSPTVCSTHCSGATSVHAIPDSGADEVNHMSVSRACMRPGGLVCILLFDHGVGHYQIDLRAWCQ